MKLVREGWKNMQTNNKIASSCLRRWTFTPSHYFHASNKRHSSVRNIWNFRTMSTEIKFISMHVRFYIGNAAAQYSTRIWTCKMTILEGRKNFYLHSLHVKILQQWRRSSEGCHFKWNFFIMRKWGSNPFFLRSLEAVERENDILKESIGGGKKKRL